MTLNLDFKVTGLLGLNALDVLCAQLTRDLFAIAKFLSTFITIGRSAFYTIYCHSPESYTAAAVAEFALSECSCCDLCDAGCQLALSVLRDFHRQLDWNVSAERPTSATGSGSSNSGDQSQTSNLPATSTVNRDVIRQRRHYTATGRSSWWSPARWRRRQCSQPRIIHR